MGDPDGEAHVLIPPLPLEPGPSEGADQGGAYRHKFTVGKTRRRRSGDGEPPMPSTYRYIWWGNARCGPQTHSMWHFLRTIGPQGNPGIQGTTGEQGTEGGGHNTHPPAHKPTLTWSHAHIYAHARTPTCTHSLPTLTTHTDTYIQLSLRLSTRTILKRTHRHVCTHRITLICKYTCSTRVHTCLCTYTHACAESSHIHAHAHPHCHKH